MFSLIRADIFFIFPRVFVHLQAKHTSYEENNHFIHPDSLLHDRMHRKSKKENSMITGNETLVRLETTMGNITVKLYDETPKHRDNFIKLVKEGVYDSTLFHRVIKNFMIQAGDPQSKTATDTTTTLGTGDVGYTIPAEINPKFSIKEVYLPPHVRAMMSTPTENHQAASSIS